MALAWRDLGAGGRVVLAAALGLVAIAVAMHTANAIAADASSDTSRLSFLIAWSIPNLIANALLVLGAVAAAAAAARRGVEGRLVWGLVAVLMLALAVDEATLDFHEHIEGALGAILVLAAKVLLSVLMVFALCPAVRALRDPAPLLLLAAGGALVISQLGELIANAGGESDRVLGGSRNLFVC